MLRQFRLAAVLLAALASASCGIKGPLVLPPAAPAAAPPAVTAPVAPGPSSPPLPAAPPVAQPKP